MLPDLRRPRSNVRMETITPLETWANSGRTITRRKSSNRVRLAYGTWAEIHPTEPWRIWESVQKARARRLLDISAEGTSLDGTIAALFYGAPIPHKNWNIELITGVKHSRHHSACKLRHAGTNAYRWVGQALGILPRSVQGSEAPSTADASISEDANTASTIGTSRPLTISTRLIESVSMLPSTRGKSLPTIREGNVRRSSRTLPPEAFTTVEGLRTLRWDYLCVELLARHPAKDAVPIVDWFVHQRVKKFKRDRAAVEEDFRSVLLKFETILAKRKDPRGRRRARRALRLISPWAESVGESILRLELHQFGFPPPTEQFEIRDGNLRFFADLAYPAYGLALEFDGILKYDGSLRDPELALRDEREREKSVRKVLPDLERFTWSEFASGSLRNRLRQLKVRFFPLVSTRRLT